MNSLDHEMPRFDDGMVNIRELVRVMAEPLVNEIVDAQAEDACADGNQRNRYRERTLVTSVGTISLRTPKLRRGATSRRTCWSATPGSIGRLALRSPR